VVNRGALEVSGGGSGLGFGGPGGMIR